jgi:Outer membrane protein beta-barrel domain
MNKLLLTIATAALAGTTMAQSTQFSFGADIALPMGDFGDGYGLGVGPAIGLELPVGDNLGVTVQVAYDFLMPKSDLKDFVKSSSMLPAQLGLKYYFSEQQAGAYGHAQLGIHASSVTSEEFEFFGVTVPSETTSNTNFSWAIGAGYQLEKLDIGLRYNSISPDSDVDGAEASSYIGLRLAYLLPLGD